MIRGQIFLILLSIVLFLGSTFSLLIKDSVNEAEEFFSDGLKLLLQENIKEKTLLLYYKGIYNSIAINTKNFQTFEEVLEALFSGRILKEFEAYKANEINTNIWSIARHVVDELLRGQLDEKQITNIFTESLAKCNKENKIDLLKQIYVNKGSRYFSFFFKNRASQLHKLLLSIFDEEYTTRYEPKEYYRSLVRRKAGELIMLRSDDCVKVYNDISQVFMILATPELVTKALIYKLIKAGESDTHSNDDQRLEFYLKRIRIVLRISMGLRLKQKDLEKQIEDYEELTKHLLDDLKIMYKATYMDINFNQVSYTLQQILFVEKTSEMMLNNINYLIGSLKTFNHIASYFKKLVLFVPMGRTLKDLLGLYYKKHFEKNLPQLRKQAGEDRIDLKLVTAIFVIHLSPTLDLAHSDIDEIITNFSYYSNINPRYISLFNWGMNLFKSGLFDFQNSYRFSEFLIETTFSMVARLPVEKTNLDFLNKEYEDFLAKHFHEAKEVDQQYIVIARILNYFDNPDIGKPDDLSYLTADIKNQVAKKLSEDRFKKLRKRVKKEFPQFINQSTESVVEDTENEKKVKEFQGQPSKDLSIDSPSTKPQPQARLDRTQEIDELAQASGSQLPVIEGPAFIKTDEDQISNLNQSLHIKEANKNVFDVKKSKEPANINVNDFSEFNADPVQNNFASNKSINRNPNEILPINFIDQQEEQSNTNNELKMNAPNLVDKKKVDSEDQNSSLENRNSEPNVPKIPEHAFKPIKDSDPSIILPENEIWGARPIAEYLMLSKGKPDDEPKPRSINKRDFNKKAQGPSQNSQTQSKSKNVHEINVLNKDPQRRSVKPSVINLEHNSDGKPLQPNTDPVPNNLVKKATVVFKTDKNEVLDGEEPKMPKKTINSQKVNARVKSHQKEHSDHDVEEKKNQSGLNPWLRKIEHLKNLQNNFIGEIPTLPQDYQAKDFTEDKEEIEKISISQRAEHEDQVFEKNIPEAGLFFNKGEDIIFDRFKKKINNQ